ncbi:hypothetical protein GCM10009527_067490 [Actinomadura nitritigenes]
MTVSGVFRQCRNHVTPGATHRRRDGLAKDGCTANGWRDVPACCGSWQALYSLFRCWQRDGTWAPLLARLQAQANAVGLIGWQGARRQGNLSPWPSLSRWPKTRLPPPPVRVKAETSDVAVALRDSWARSRPEALS